MNRNSRIAAACRITLILLLPSFCMGQAVPDEIRNPRYLQGTLILGVKPDRIDQWKAVCANDAGRPLFLKELRDCAVSRLFPLHQPPPAAKAAQGWTDLSLIYRMDFDPAVPVQSLAGSLLHSGFFKYVEPLYVADPMFIPDDEKLPNQAYLARIGAFDAWDVCTGDSSVTVGIVDSGTDLDHEDLWENLAYNFQDPIDGADNDNDGFTDNFHGWDLGEMDNDPQVMPGGGSAESHGVHMCGIAAASTDNGTGVAGTGFRCRFLPVKINDANNQFIAGYQGIVYAADHGCRVINCSWGTPFGAGKFAQDIIGYATFNRDALVVAACGNADNEIPYYPASCEHVMSVGATGPQDEKMFVYAGYGSSYGIHLDVCAPGKDIYNTWDYPYFYKSLSGTSMACAVVSGAAALVRSHRPSLSAIQTAELLRVTADRIDTLPANLPYLFKLGSGRINLFRALTDTLSPSLRLEEITLTGTSLPAGLPGDTLRLSGILKNYLAGVTGMEVTVSCPEPSVMVLDSTHFPGNLPAGASVSLDADPFTLLLLPGIETVDEIPLLVRYHAQDYSAFEWISPGLQRDYLDVDHGRLKTTVTDAGRFGYTDDWNTRGRGFCYDDDLSLLSGGGFIIGTGYAAVSDAVYGMNGFDRDFGNAVPLSKPDLQADLEVMTAFHDSLAGAASLGISAEHRVLGWDGPDFDNFLVHELKLVNKGPASLANLYAGLFIDWDIRHFAPMYDQVTWDSAEKMSVTNSLSGGAFAGISLVSATPVRHYAFDLDGSNGSIKVTDGFSSQEKYTALKSNRHQAGSPGVGNNVADLVSTGPFLLPPGDTLTLTFAVMAADHPGGLKLAAQRARQQYFQVPGSETSPEDTGKPEVRLFPNPAMEKSVVTVFLDRASALTVSLYTLAGMQVAGEKAIQGYPGRNDLSLDLRSLAPGVYLVRTGLGSGVDYSLLIRR